MPEGDAVGEKIERVLVRRAHSAFKNLIDEVEHRLSFVT